MTTPRQVFAMGLLAVLCAGAAPFPKRGDIALEYHGIPACPGEAAFRQRAADLFDFDDPFVRPGAPASLRMRITLTQKGPAGFHADFEVVDATGVTVARTFEEHDDCDALGWVLAHRVRLAIPGNVMTGSLAERVKTLEQGYNQLESRFRQLEEESGAARRAIAGLEQQSKALAGALERQRRRDMDWTFALSAGALMTANLTSNVGPGIWAGGDARVGPFLLGVELRTALPAEVVVGSQNFDLSQYMALAVPCFHYSVFLGCAVAGAGLEVAHDSNYSAMAQSPATQFLPLVQLGARLGVEIPLGESPFAARGWAEVLFTPMNATFSYYEGDILRDRGSRPNVSAFFGLGIVYIFGE